MPAIPQFPRSVPVLVTAVARWDDAAAAYVTAEYVVRPLGAIRVTAAGTYRIAASVTPSLTYPTVVDEAVARLFAYRESYKPRPRGERSQRRERAEYHGRDDEKWRGRVHPIYPHTGGVRWLGSSGWPSIAARHGRGSERRARRRRAVCVRTAIGFGFECHHVVPLYLNGPHDPSLAGVVWLCRACHFQTTPIAAAHRVGRACAEVEWRYRV